MSRAVDERQVLDHARFLRRLVQGLVADEHAANDVVQETWLAGLQKPPPSSIHDGHLGHLGGWLARVARRLAGRFHRSASRRAARERIAARPERLGATVDLVTCEESLRAVTDAVLALDEPYRSAVMLRYYEGLAPEEIARRHAIPVATVHSRLQRARERLRARLEPRRGSGLLGWLGGSARAGAGIASIGATGALLVTSSAKAGWTIAVVAAAGVAWWIGGPDLSKPEDRAAAPSALAAEPRVAAASDAAPPEAAPAADGVAVATRSEEAAAAVTPVDPAFASVLLHISWAKDHTPAPGRSVNVIQWKAPPALRSSVRSSGADGCVRFEKLRPGKLYFEADLGGEAEVDALPGRLTEATLEIPAGYVVRGRVLDRERRPIAGAAIWLSSYFNYESGGVVGASDAEGRFELPCVPEARYLAATSSGHTPSDLVYLEDLHRKLESERQRAAAMAQAGGAPADGAAIDGAVVVEFVLSEVCASLRGVVLDPDGHPAAGAAVHVVGELPAAADPQQDRGVRMIAPYDVITDGDGRFQIEGLPVGRAKVSVLHPSSARQETSCNLIADETTDLVFRLAGAGSVAGRVVDGSGHPIVKADVRLDVPYDFLDPSAETDAEGRFVLDAMPLGAAGIRASHPDHGKGKARVTVAKGAATSCEIVLEAGLVLAGQLVDASGRPLAGLGIEANEESRQFWGQAKTDREGRFRILNCPSGPLQVAVKKEFTDGQPLMSVRDVRAGGESLRLVFDAASAVSIHATVLLPDGRPALVMMTPWLEGTSSANCHNSDPTTGAIDVQGLAPGRYSISLRADDGPVRDLGFHVLKAGDRLDLGTIVLQPPGRMRVKEDDGVAAFDLFFQVFSLDHDPVGLGAQVETFDARSAQAGVALAPGKYVICASGRDVALASRRFEVLSGQETVVELRAEPGVDCVVELDLPPDLPATMLVHAWIEGSGLLAPLPIYSRGRNSSGIQVGSLRLLPGSYRLFVDLGAKESGGSAASGHADVEVVAGAPLRVPIRVR